MKLRIFVCLTTFFLLFCSGNGKATYGQTIVTMGNKTNSETNTEIIDGFYTSENNIVEDNQETPVFISMAKELELIHSVTINEEFAWLFYDWNNNRMFFTPLSYLDLSDMNIKSIMLPNENYEVLRAPYSNNNLHVIIDNEYFIYNINDKTVNGPVKDLSYIFTSHDSDRRYSHNVLFNNEYTFAIENGWSYQMLTDMGERYSGYNGDNDFIINKIDNEFSNTIFDSEDIMGLIKIVNNTLNGSGIITRNDCSLSSTWSGENRYSKTGDKLDIRFEVNKQYSMENNEYDPAIVFLYNLLKIFPENNVVEELYVRTNKGAYGSVHQSLRINIYDKGFYVYTHEKLILLNIETKTIDYYNITINSGDRGDQFKLSPDGSTCYFYRWRTTDFEIYKLKHDNGI